ncbi:protein FAM83B-like isoform X2 [Engraulis encrasicolus]
MDIFTDVDIFRDLVEVSTRGVVVYILLDDQQFASFFRMSEKANIPLQKLWNVRIRTVKGHEYRCQSGARFHGAMEQRFMLVDCHTALYGSYSFMWSYEKINLSMVLLITGKLVASYDEEFRRLFARSIIPTLLIQPATTTTTTTDFGSPRIQPSKFGLHSTQLFERSNSFDTAALKTIRGGRVNVLSHGDRPEDAMQANGAALRRGLNFQRTLAADLAKQNSNLNALQNRLYSSMHQRNRVLTGKGNEGLEGVNPFSSLVQLNHIGQNWQPNQENNALLQGPQSFLSASEMSLQKWRLESYLKYDHVPADSSESLDCLSVKSDSKSSLLSNPVARPNLTFKATETSGAMKSPYLGRRAITSVYSSLQKAKDNSLLRDLQKTEEKPVENKRSEEPTIRPATQPQSPEPRLRATSIFDQPPVKVPTDVPLPETNHQPPALDRPFSPGAESFVSCPTSPAASLLFSPESSIVSDNEQGTDAMSSAKQKLTETQRSISHYDIKTVEEKKDQSYDWQQPPSRTASAMNLGNIEDNTLMKGSNLKRLRPFSDSNKTRLSLIEIPEEEGSRRNLDELGSRTNLERAGSRTNLERAGSRTNLERAGSRTNLERAGSRSNLSELSASRQNLTRISLTNIQPTPIEPTVHISGLGIGGYLSPTASYSSVGRAQHPSTPTLHRALGPIPWSSSRRPEEERVAAAVAAAAAATAAAAAASPRTLSALDVAGNHHRVDHGSLTSVATVESVMSNPDQGRYGIPEGKRNKVYSRFEHFLVERKTPDKVEAERMNMYSSADKRRNLLMGGPTSYTRYQTQTQSDNNRFGKFIQRVGSFINKNK